MKPDEQKTVYDGQTIDVTLERWGESDREIVEHPSAVAIVAIDRQGRIVLVRQLREAIRDRLLELPAGKMDSGEDPLTTGKRELREECGLTGGTWTPLSTFWTTPGFCREEMHVFLAEGLDEGETDPDEGEEVEVVRWTLDEVESRIAEIRDAKTLVGLLLFLRRRASTS
jgi:ADP-ribose pyrophosphatase